ncbi:MAG TPA: ATP-dependent Clp protease adaptor ClpS [Planctomycetota bacterium]|nr:ATP-dependent Clp protease adaptor ClpS [Planctomycetota bacterium]
MPVQSPVLEPRVETTPETRLAPLYRVLIHNDDVTPMDFVVRVLREVFHLSLAGSMQIMITAHLKGVAHVVTEPLERAEFHVDQARSLSRARKFPLTFSVERED